MCGFCWRNFIDKTLPSPCMENPFTAVMIFNLLLYVLLTMYMYYTSTCMYILYASLDIRVLQCLLCGGAVIS